MPGSRRTGPEPADRDPEHLPALADLVEGISLGRLDQVGYEFGRPLGADLRARLRRRCKAEVRLAEIGLNALLADALLRYKVAASRRLAAG